MKIITMVQPYASLCANGAKRIETRSWTTPYRGLLAIHAAKYRNAFMASLAQQELFASALGEQELFYGAIVAVCTLADIVPGTLVLQDPARYSASPHELMFGHYHNNEYAWLLTQPIRLPQPIPCMGRQGIRSCSPSLCQAIYAQLPTHLQSSL